MDRPHDNPARVRGSAQSNPLTAGSSSTSSPQQDSVEAIRGQLDHIYAGDNPDIDTTTPLSQPSATARPTTAGRPTQPSQAIRHLRRGAPTMYPIQDYMVRSSPMPHRTAQAAAAPVMRSTNTPASPVLTTTQPSTPDQPPASAGSSPTQQTTPLQHPVASHGRPTRPDTTARSIAERSPTSAATASASSHSPIAAPHHTNTSTQPTPVASASTVSSTAKPPQAARTTPPQATPEEWNQYHSAWQKYYQTYYQRYYTQQMLALQQQAAQPGGTNQFADASQAGLSQQGALQELRSHLRQKVADSAKRVTTSRHFIPALAAGVVILVFIVLQYNQNIAAAFVSYTSPGNIDPQNIIVDTATDVAVSQDPKLIIPKLNVDAPVVYNIGPDHESQMAAMQRGVAHYAIPGANAVPGQIGNTVIAGHSSNDAFSPGDYKFVFAQNEKLSKNDIIYMNYQGKRYTYSITETKVVLPQDIQSVQLKTTKPMLTLISCVPLGTAEKRLLVIAEQISPDPKKATAAHPQQNQPTSTPSGNIPGQSAPTLLERLFGAR